jgi:hypothetical protein
MSGMGWGRRGREVGYTEERDGEEGKEGDNLVPSNKFPGFATGNK